MNICRNNCLKRAGFSTLREVSEMTFDELCHVRNLGKKALTKYAQCLQNTELNLTARKDKPK